MMVIYRIASYLLIMIAVFLGIMDTMALMIALANPALLLQVFIIACVVIYSFTAFSFLIKGLDQQRALKTRTRDLIRVNGFVALFFAVLLIVQFITLTTNPQLWDELLQQAYQLQQPGAEGLSQSALKTILKGTMYFLLGYGLVLLFHILFTFQLLKRNAHLFLDLPQE